MTERRHDPALPDAQAPEDRLDRALAASLRPPELPPGFAPALMARIAQEKARDLARQRRELAVEHERAMHDLRKGYLRLRPDTLITALAAAFTTGAAATVALPALARWAGTDLPTIVAWTAGALALALAAAAIDRRLRPQR